MKQISNCLKVLVLIFLFIQCEKDAAFIETAPQTGRHAHFKVKTVSAKQLSKITGFLATEHINLLQKDTISGAVFDTDNIIEVIDNLNTTNYSFRFVYPNTPEHVFYNLVVGVDAEGALKTPYVLRYECDAAHLKAFTESGFNFHYFKGNISHHRFTDFFQSNDLFGKTTTDCTQFDQYGDPLACEETSIDGSGPSGSGGSTEVGSGTTGETVPGTASPSGNGGFSITVYHIIPSGDWYVFGPGSVCQHPGECEIVIAMNGQDEQQRTTTECPPCTLPTGGVGVSNGIIMENALTLNNILDNILTDAQIDWLNDRIYLVEELIQFITDNGFSAEAKTESLMRLYAEMANENGWDYTQTGTFLNRPALDYIATYKPNIGETMYLLENDLVLYQSATKRIINPAQDATTLASSEPELEGYNYIYSYSTKRWYEYRLPKPSYTETDLSFLFETFWDGVKLIGRYATPLEDIMILIDGKDFDGEEANKALAGGMLIVGFIPGGKIVKPLAKTIKTATTAIEIVIKEGGHYVIEGIGMAVNVEIKAIPLDNIVKYISSTGKEVARIANDVFTVSKHQIKPQTGSVVFRNADEVNSSLIQFGYNDPPFTDAVVEFVTEESEQFVRFHNISNRKGPWIMKASEVQSLTENQIRDLFSIPPGNPIPKVSYVDVPAGTKIYSGTANGLNGFNGGGQQFYIDRTQFLDNFVPNSWFGMDIDINDFLN